MRRTLFYTVIFFALLGKAWACPGQVGNVIFEDKFEDDSGGWDLTPPNLIIKPPEMVITFDDKVKAISSQVLTFNATDADYCVEALLPKSLAPDNLYYLAVEFWGTDYSNFFQLSLSSAGQLSFYKRSLGTWTTIFSSLPVTSFNPDPTAVTSLRVVAKENKLTLYVNGTQVKVIRAQAPQGNLRFGTYGQVDKIAEGLGPIRVKSFKVTAGQ